MNPQSPHSNSQGAPDAETTLRLIAQLPARDGLEDRVHAALAAALESGDASGVWPARGTGKVLAWRAQNNWMRAAAAAAIAMVVAGGGWGVYLRVQQPLPGSVAVPARIGTPGGFSGAGAIRTPQTLNRPVLTSPAEASKTIKKAAGAKAVMRKGAKQFTSEGPQQSAPAAQAVPQPDSPAGK